MADLCKRLAPRRPAAPSCRARRQSGAGPRAGRSRQSRSACTGWAAGSGPCRPAGPHGPAPWTSPGGCHRRHPEAGAGNGTQHCGGAKTYPASYESCLSVTSVGHKNAIGVLENGVARNWKDVHERFVGDSTSTHQHNDAVDICAPGYDVFSTAYQNTYAYSTGTSFAAPQVAGVAAMIMAVNPNLTANEVVNILKSTADTTIYNIPQNANYIGKLGTGRLDAYKAVKTACSVDFNSTAFTGTSSETGCYISVTNSTIQNGANVTFDATKEVALLSGFEVQAGAVFEAK
ncbi:MAG: S8 family serine peptidase [Bacteroidales bacterium]